VYLLLRYFAILPAILLENQTVTDAFHRSRDLSLGFKWRILGTMFLSWVIMFVVIALLQTVFVFVKLPPLAAQLVSAAASIFIGPLITITLTVLYYDQRVRKDGFDLEVATRDLAPAPAH
jgi:membrane-anchored glycerophosphoryl diester phosphodiesterase (GDPDase)